MRVRPGRKAFVCAVATSLVSGAIVLTSAQVALAVKPVFTKFPAENIPTGETTDLAGRLYMTTPAETLPDNIPSLVGIPTDGTLEFTGTDLIADVERTIEIGSAPNGPLGCEPEAPDYVVDDCPRVQLSLSTSDTEGGISFVSSLTRIEEGAVDRFRHPSGVIIDVITDNANPDNPSQAIHFNGTQDAINSALADLRYTVGPDYHYTGTSPEITLEVRVIAGDASDNTVGYIEIRVLDVNGFPSHDGPDNAGPLQPQVEHLITGFTVADSDNDENAGDRADPPEPDEDLKDGPGANMMLIGVLDCGQPVAPDTGFHWSSSVFENANGTVDEYLVNLLDGTPADTSDIDVYLDALRAGIDAIDPTIRNIQLSTSNPTTFTTAFAGITTMNEVMDALLGVTFRHDAPGDTCDLITIVLDLGNNGLPLRYIVAGENPNATGWEVPMVGFDWNVLTITTDELDEVDISFDATPLFFDEGIAPDAAEAELHISPATHPEFTVKWDALPRVIDPPPGPGVATPNSDFQGTFNNTLTIPENATSVTISTNVFPDAVDEGNETFQYVLDLSEPAPPGWEITSTTPSRTVVILDDDDAGRTLTSVSNPSVTEGDSGTTNMNFTLTLDGPADGTETVDVDTVDGTAELSDNDYVDLSDTVTFAPGATTATVTVEINGDTDDEPNETLTLELSNESNVTLSDDEGTGTILNDDDPRTVTAVSAPATPEGNPPSTPTMPFTITLDNPAKAGDSVHVTTSGADEGVDYNDIDQVVMLTPGQLTTTVNVTIIGDDTIEGDEVVTLSLDSPSPGVVLGVSSGTGTIVNDDGIPAASIDDVTVTEGDSGTVTASFTVSLSAPAVGGEQVTVATADGTALAPTDYLPVGPQVITFGAGDTSATVNVTVIGDTDPELDQNFFVELSAPSGLTIADGSGTGTITNDDILVTFVLTAAIPEGDSDTVPLTIFPAIHPPLDLFVTTSDGSASAPDDYTPLIAQLVPVPADATSVDVLFNTQQDGFFESDQTFTAQVVPGAPPMGFTVRTVPPTDTTTITIIDDDPQPTVSVADVTVIEGDPAMVPLTLSNANHTCVANYSTTEGTATDPEDFAMTSGQVSLPPSTTVPVVTVDDPDIEGAHAFTVSITLDPSSDPECVLGTDTATVTIVDNDDPSPTLSIADASVTEGTGPGTTTISFTVTTSGVQPADCGYRVTLTHTSTDDDDFTAPATFDLVDTFTTSDITVSRDFGVTRDGTDEPDETFTVTIAGEGAAPCAIGDAVATGTIIDDDLPAVDMTPPDVTVTPVGPNPTSVTPIEFTVQFTEAVTGFDAGDVVLGGTAGASGVSVSSVDADTYTVTVTTVPATGTVTVTVPADSAVDGAGNPNTASNTASVQFNLPVVDNQPPTVSVIAAGPSPTTASPVTFTIQFSEPVTGLTLSDLTVTGPAGFTPSLTPVDGDTYTVSVQGMTAAGNITVTVPANSAQDAAMNGNTASNTAVVEFQLAPGPLTLNLPSNIVRNNDPGQAGAVVTFAATASGGAPPVVVTCDHPSGSFFPIGTTTVSCTATDAEEGVQEAIVSGTFTVQVIDVEPPVIADLPDLTRTTTGTTPVVVTFPLPAASDNSGVVPTVVCTPASGSSFQVGVATVTCTATDGAGLTASSSFTVTVTSTPIQPPTPGPTPLPPTGSSPAGILFLAGALVALGALLAGTRRRQHHGL